MASLALCQVAIVHILVDRMLISGVCPNSLVFFCVERFQAAGFQFVQTISGSELE